MKNTVFMLGLMLGISMLSTNVLAQGASRGPDPAVIRDAELERDSAHHLEVAQLYFRTRKAYVSALLRCEEIMAGNPTFSKIDEVLYISGMSSLYLSQKRGKQAPKDTAEQYRDDARKYLTQLVDQFPESSFRDDAQKALRTLGPDVTTKTEEKKSQ